MGGEESKSGGSSSQSPSWASGGIDFPNNCQRASEATAWTLLHQVTLDKWKEGHAEAAGFRETVLTCDGIVFKDCSFSFCMSRQGIININKGSSFFSFRKRSKFAKMAEHFEYNHIPAQLSSIHHFRVKSVLCFRDSLVVLHLSRNTTSQFGLLDLRVNKFIGIFAKQHGEVMNEVIDGELSPDKSKCLIKVPILAGRGPPQSHRFQIYDLSTMTLLTETHLPFDGCHFTFDPRFKWQRIAATNFESGHNNSLSLVQVQKDSWSVLATNTRVLDTRRNLYPYMRDLRYTPDGSLIIATILDNLCYCRERKTRLYRPVSCSVYIFSSETTATLRCIQYNRYTCTQHQCPVNYTPVFSACGNRIALVMNVSELPTVHFVQVYKLPSPLNLQSLCRVAIIQNFASDILTDLPLPLKLINYLHFKPEFEV